jgi:hypothetical protein
MFGQFVGGTDIPAGPIHGLDREGVVGLVKVGVMGMDRKPFHK